MDTAEYRKVLKHGHCKALIVALRAELDTFLSFQMLDAKIRARARTKPNKPSGNEPKFYFSPKFFTKLNMMPAVSIEVKESRSHIRKTCYGFRCHRTGERVYLRIDPGSVVEFRDSPCGYIIGTRYLIPKINKMMVEVRWDKVSRKLTRLLTRDGIIVTVADVRKYSRSHRRRCRMADRIVKLRTKSRPKLSL